MIPEEVRHDGSYGSTSSPVEAAATFADMLRSSQRWTDMILEIAKVVTGAFSLGVEVFVRPLFGSTYYNPVGYFMGIFLWAFCTIATLMMGGSLNSGFGMTAMGLFNILTFSVVVIQGYRFYLALNDYGVEENSRLAGPAWWFFSKLPGGDRWGLTRIVYEPALCALIPISLWVVNILNGYTALYYTLAACCLSAKGILTYYDVWKHGRRLLDDQSQLPYLQSLAQGNSPTSLQAPTPPPLPVRVRHVVRTSVV
jgi:hypothetical protein